MAEVKILIEGYAKEQDGYEYASSSATLIRENNLNIIIDPGMNRELLLESLKREKLSLNDINFVLLTHYHLDHSLLAGIFDKAKVLDNGSIYSFDGKIENHGGKIPGTNIEIIDTPGHDQFHCSILVDTQEYGKVAVAGDIFWWLDNEERKTDADSLINREDPYVKNEKELKESRKRVLKLADYIIPGHGQMFKVKK